jgi:hypothetical protein
MYWIGVGFLFCIGCCLFAIICGVILSPKFWSAVWWCTKVTVCFIPVFIIGMMINNWSESAHNEARDDQMRILFENDTEHKFVKTSDGKVWKVPANQFNKYVATGKYVPASFEELKASVGK